MSGAVRRVIPMVLAVAVAAGLVALYRAHQRDVAQNAERSAPVVAPSRVRAEGGDGAGHAGLRGAATDRRRGRGTAGGLERARGPAPRRSRRRERAGHGAPGARGRPTSRCPPAHTGRGSASGWRRARRSPRSRMRARWRSRSPVSSQASARSPALWSRPARRCSRWPTTAGRSSASRGSSPPASGPAQGSRSAPTSALRACRRISSVRPPRPIR